MNDEISKQFTFLMPPATRERLKALAAAERRSMTQQIITLINDGYEALRAAEQENQRGQWDES